MTLKQLQDNGWLRPHATSPEEIGNLLAIADRDLQDAQGGISPDWRFGIASTEREFIYVTTAHLGHEQLQQLSDEVGPERTLLVLCTAFRAKADRYPNLTVKKIPKTVLSRCEWGHDDYSLRVENLPKAPPKPGQLNMFGEATK